MWLADTVSNDGDFNFYSHIPCGMWRRLENGIAVNTVFLLTHPVWDVTVSHRIWGSPKQNFYSHIPCGMWHCRSCKRLWRLDISTHTSRVGCDLTITRQKSLQQISTHTSRVGCDAFKGNGILSAVNFYSHIPCGMWHLQCRLHRKQKSISTHTSRVGCDYN